MRSAASETAVFIRRMLSAESGGWGDEAQALRRLARLCQVSFWTLNNLRIGRARTVNADVRDRIRQAFVDHCRSHAARLLHDAEMVAASGSGNDALEDIANQIRALSVELEACKGKEVTK